MNSILSRYLDPEVLSRMADRHLQPRGLVIRDTPRPESQGGRELRVVPVGAQLYAYGIHNIAGVPYARLVPLNPQKPEWVRVAEADHSVEYADVIELTDETVDTSQIAEAIIRLAIAVERLPR